MRRGAGILPRLSLFEFNGRIYAIDASCPSIFPLNHYPMILRFIEQGAAPWFLALVRDQGRKSLRTEPTSGTACKDVFWLVFASARCCRRSRGISLPRQFGALQLFLRAAFSYQTT